MSRDMTCSLCGIEYHTRDYSLPLMCDNCKVTAERNHYQSALEGIANLMNKPTAGLSNACAIARAALDGEG